MKKATRIFSLLIVTILCSSLTLSAKTVKGESHSQLGTYWLKKAANHMVVNGKELDTYSVHYENFNTSIHIGIIGKEKNCTEFVVRTDDFEILYTCKNGQFGIKYMPNRYSTMPKAHMKQTIDKSQFAYQQMISASAQSQNDLLQMIAVYLPDVMG